MADGGTPSAVTYHGSTTNPDELDSAAINHEVPCLAINTDVSVWKLVQNIPGSVQAIQYAEYHSLFFSGSCSFPESGQFNLDTGPAGRAYFKLTNWSLPEIDSCADLLSRLSNDKLNVLNLVNAVYEARKQDFASTVNPRDKIGLVKALLPIKLLSDLGDSTCTKGYVGLDVADVKELIANEVLPCDVVPVAVINKTLGHVRTSASQVTGRKWIDVFVTCSIASPNPSLPTINLKFPCAVAAQKKVETSQAANVWNKENLKVSDLQPDDPSKSELKDLYYSFVISTSDLVHDPGTGEVAIDFGCAPPASAIAKVKTLINAKLSEAGLVALCSDPEDAGGEKTVIYDLLADRKSHQGVEDSGSTVFLLSVGSSSVLVGSDGSITPSSTIDLVIADTFVLV